MILQSLLWESRSPPSLCQAPAPRHAPGAFGVCGADGRAAARASRARPEPWARRQREAIPTEGARQGPCDGAQMGGPWLRCGAESGEWYPKAGERWRAGGFGIASGLAQGGTERMALRKPRGTPGIGIAPTGPGARERGAPQGGQGERGLEAAADCPIQKPRADAKQKNHQHQAQQHVQIAPIDKYFPNIQNDVESAHGALWHGEQDTVERAKRMGEAKKHGCVKYHQRHDNDVPWHERGFRIQELLEEHT